LEAGLAAPAEPAGLLHFPPQEIKTVTPLRAISAPLYLEASSKDLIQCPQQCRTFPTSSSKELNTHNLLINLQATICTNEAPGTLIKLFAGCQAKAGRWAELSGWISVCPLATFLLNARKNGQKHIHTHICKQQSTEGK